MNEPINTPRGTQPIKPAELDPGMVEPTAPRPTCFCGGSHLTGWCLSGQVHWPSIAEEALARATSAEQERDRLRAGVEALASEYERPSPSTLAYRAEVARALRALLAGSGEQPAPTALVRVEWGVVLDDLGSTDVYDTREEAEARAVRDSTVVRIETWRVGSGEQLGCECYDTGGNYGVCAEHAEDARHPESYCHRCGGPNITWWAPSPVWNHVMGYPEEAHDGIVCPLCFAELAEAKGAGEGWRVEPGRWPEGVSLVHTDGRVWDDRAGLWVDPAPVVPDSRDVRERVRRAVKRAATWTEDGPEYEEAPDAGMVEEITDAVLAVVRPTGQDPAPTASDEGGAA